MSVSQMFSDKPNLMSFFLGLSNVLKPVELLKKLVVHLAIDLSIVVPGSSRDEVYDFLNPSMISYNLMITECFRKNSKVFLKIISEKINILRDCLGN